MRVVGGLGLAGALILFPATTGYAASLSGITSADLLVQSGEPGVIGSMSDGFASNKKEDLDGRTLADGQVWSAPAKDFEVNQGECVPTKNNLPLTLATLPWLSIPTTRVTSTIVQDGAGQFGLLLQADASTSTGVALRFLAGGTVEIARLHNGNWATLASTTATAVGTWSLGYDHGTYTASRNGTALLSYTASPSENTAWRANRDVGIFAEGPNAKDAIWTTFIVETP